VRGWLAEHLPRFHRGGAVDGPRRRDSGRDATIAAIASALAGELYGVPILRARVEDNPHNSTRFLVVGTIRAARRDTNKTSRIRWSVPGSLRIRKRIDVLSCPSGRLDGGPRPGSGSSCGVVLHACPQNRHTIELTRERRGDRSDRGVTGRYLGGEGRRQHLLGGPRAGARRAPAHCRQPCGCDSTRLTSESSPARDRAAGDVQTQLAADDHVRVDQAVERAVDGTLGAVFHRHHAEVGPPPLDLIEHLGGGTRRPIAHGRAEALEGGLVREGGLRPEIGNGQRRSRARHAERISRQMAVASTGSGRRPRSDARGSPPHAPRIQRASCLRLRSPIWRRLCALVEELENSVARSLILERQSSRFIGTPTTAGSRGTAHYRPRPTKSKSAPARRRDGRPQRAHLSRSQRSRFARAKRPRARGPKRDPPELEHAMAQGLTEALDLMLAPFRDVSRTWLSRVPARESSMASGLAGPSSSVTPRRQRFERTRGTVPSTRAS